MISDGFVNPSPGGYPVLACFADNDAANAGSAMLLLAENDTYGKVSGEITLVGRRDVNGLQPISWMTKVLMSNQHLKKQLFPSLSRLTEDALFRRLPAR